MKRNLREVLAEYSPADRVLFLARLTHTLTVRSSANARMRFTMSNCAIDLLSPR